MIEYVEIRDTNRNLIGIVDTAESIIWESSYYSTGRFEVYVQANSETIPLLQVGNYVTRPNERNIGIIEGINITYLPVYGRMIIASGRFAKSILDRRLIYTLRGNSITPTISSGLVEAAVRNLVNKNIIASSLSRRNIPFIKLGTLQNITKRIVDDNGNSARMQTSYGNLLEYTDTMLQEFGLGAYMSLDYATNNLLYNVFEGADRSASNTQGNNPVVFSQEYDNLVSTDYRYETVTEKTTALIGGEGEGTERYFVMIGDTASGIARKEVMVDASGQSRTYEDEDETEHTYTDAEYAELLKSYALKEMEEYQIVQTFSGEVDVSHSDLVYGVDYNVGDIITIHDMQLSLYMNTRILTATEVQDSSGYKLSITYGV